MSCPERQKQLQDYVSGDLAPEARRGLQLHLDACRACRQDVAAYRLLMDALPLMPDPTVPKELPDEVMVAVRAISGATRPERETATATLLRRTFKYAFAFAFAVALSAALWGWAARIVGFATRSLSRNLVAVWDAAKDLWYLLQLLADVASLLKPVAGDLWAVASRVSAPLAPYGIILVLAYAAALALGTLLCWRALSSRSERRLSHAS